MSSPAVMYVVLDKVRGLGSGKTVVALLPDNGGKYLSTELFE